MDKAYKEAYKEVQSLRFKLQDYLDDHAHAIAQSLKREVQRLEDEMEMSKSPRSLEDRIKGIQRQLQSAQGAMSVEHADWLHDRFESLKMSLRRLPNY
jgi:hypothetical protein